MKTRGHRLNKKILALVVLLLTPLFVSFISIATPSIAVAADAPKPGCPGAPDTPKPADDANYDCPDGGKVVDGEYKPSDEPKKTCENSTDGLDVFGWVMCGMIEALDKGLTWLDNQIRSLLYIDEDVYTNNKIRNVWGAMRNVAIIILVPMMLVMVIGTAVGFGPFDAYTVKKALPRMAIAAIFISLSWQFCTLLIQLTNVIGTGIMGLMTSPFLGADGKAFGLDNVFNPDDAAKASGGILLGAFAAGMVAINIPALAITAMLAVIGLVIGWLVLVVRQAVLIVLLIMAPLAILPWIFPGNDKLWKIWRESFTNLLLLFPLIMVLLAGGRIFAEVMRDADTLGGLSFLNFIMMLVAYVFPYFMIRTAFKFGGTAMAALSGRINNMGGGFTGGLRKRRSGEMAGTWNKARNFSRFNDKTKFGNAVNTALGAATRPGTLMGGAAGVRSMRATARANYGQGALKNDEVWAANENDDNFLLAVSNRKLATTKLTASQKKFNTARDARAAALSAGNTDEAQKQLEIMNSSKADIDARQNGLNAADRMSHDNKGSRAVRLAAFNKLTTTGYQFSAGQEGYDELRDTLTELTGGHPEQMAAAMDNAQFNLKNAGRGDLAGINHGQGLDVKAGVRKAGNYGRGQGKTDTYHAAAGAWLGDGVLKDGKTADQGEMSRYLAQEIQSGRMSHDELTEYHTMLAGDYNSATDANKLEIKKQMQAIEMAVDVSMPDIGQVKSQLDPQVRSQVAAEVGPQHRAQIESQLRQQFGAGPLTANQQQTLDQQVNTEFSNTIQAKVEEGVNRKVMEHVQPYADLKRKMEQGKSLREQTRYTDIDPSLRK